MSAVGGGVAQAQSPCTLDVWLSPGLETSSDGSWLIKPHNGDLRDKTGKPTALASTLTPTEQRAVIAAIDLPALFARPGAQVVIHDAPPAASEAPVAGGCGADLILRHIVFSDVDLTEPALQGIFAYHTSAADGAPGRAFSTLVSAPLPGYRALTAQGADAVSTLFSKALTQDVEQFAHYATAPPRHHH